MAGIKNRNSALTWIMLCATTALISCAPDDAPDNEPNEPKKLSHFLCYQTQGPSTGLYDSVTLQDQFNPPPKRPVQFNMLPGGERFCNPVEKTKLGEDPESNKTSAIEDRDHHLLAIPGSPPVGPQEGSVTVVNQFFPEGQTLTVSTTTGQYLMVPAHKIGMDPQPDDWQRHDKPKGLNHFKCYPASSPQSTSANVDLKDQAITRKNVPVGDVQLLCNPTVKWHEGHNGYDPVPIQPSGTKDHLVCYDVQGDVARVGYTLKHQLDNSGRNAFSAEKLAWLCLPSTKTRLDGWWSDNQ